MDVSSSSFDRGEHELEELSLQPALVSSKAVRREDLFVGVATYEDRVQCLARMAKHH